MEVTNENYFSKEMEMKYVGSSQIKNFLKCEAAALARVKGEWTEKKNKSMLVSSYIDEAISGTLDLFKAQTQRYLKKMEV